VVPIWTLKLGAMALTAASAAGFWRYVTGHVHPVKAPLHPKVVQVATQNDVQWAYDPNDPAYARPAAGQAPVIVKKVLVTGTQSQVQSQASLGAAWVANKTGQKPVTITYVS
jgi:hypothetical protein